MYQVGFVEALDRSDQCLAERFAVSAEDGGEGGADEDYASSGSEADDEATLEEEDALAAQDGLDQKVCASLLPELTFDLQSFTSQDGLSFSKHYTFEECARRKDLL